MAAPGLTVVEAPVLAVSGEPLVSVAVTVYEPAVLKVTAKV